MENPLRLVIPPSCFGSVDYYAAISAAGHVTVNTATRFDKRAKSTHRFAIADTRGRLELTVPVAKPYGPTWADVTVSDHGHWWTVLPVALASAYGRTPFFEFYIDRFAALFSEKSVGLSVAGFCEAADRAVRAALGLTTDVTYAAAAALTPLPPVRPVTYWQLRADRFGFIPGLSVLDLLFNMGPESVLVLRRMTAAPAPTD